jgi:hypothetical protein
MIAITLPGLVVALAACASIFQSQPKLSEQGPDIRGYVIDVYEVEGRRKGLSVAGEIEPDTRYGRASIGFIPETRIFRLTPDGYRLADITALQAGQLVEVKFIGPVGESYPVQATAAEVIILESPPSD